MVGHSLVGFRRPRCCRWMLRSVADHCDLGSGLTFVAQLVQTAAGTDAAAEDDEYYGDDAHANNDSE